MEPRTFEPSGPRAPAALVVLGCRISGGRPRGAAERRAETAARAFLRDDFARVVASGGRRWNGVAEADFLAERLVAHGVPAERIVRELCSLSTLENAAYSARLLAEEGIRRAVLVTCDFHASRAVRCFSWMGVAATAIAAPSPSGPGAARAIGEWFRAHLDRHAAAAWVDP